MDGDTRGHPCVWSLCPQTPALRRPTVRAQATTSPTAPPWHLYYLRILCLGTGACALARKLQSCVDHPAACIDIGDVARESAVALRVGPLPLSQVARFLQAR